MNLCGNVFLTFKQETFVTDTFYLWASICSENKVLACKKKLLNDTQLCMKISDLTDMC